MPTTLPPVTKTWIFVMHLGDFMYEYNRGMLAPQVYGRQGFRHMPSSTRETGHFDSPAMSGELLDFDDCITRYCSYRADPGLQAVSSAAPLPPTSNGFETATTPNDLAIVSGNENMRYASTNGRSTAIITLTQEKAHVEYYYFDQPSQMIYQGVCDAGLDYYHTSDLEEVGLTSDDNDMIGSRWISIRMDAQDTVIFMSNPHLRDVAF